MATGPDTLTDTLSDKEKDALRLLLRGHDAKSSARELGLSVHTVNERLREARRKLGVTSSREAARRLLEAEGQAPETLADKRLGGAATAALEDTAASATGRWAWPRFVLPTMGVLAMSLVLAALFLPASPDATDPPVVPVETAVLGEMQTLESTKVAGEFLALVDAGRWAESYAATEAQFRALNTLERWSTVSERARAPLGKLVARDLIDNEFVPAPPSGYRLVRFRSRYANGTTQTESLSLAWEDGAWKVAGITFD